MVVLTKSDFVPEEEDEVDFRRETTISAFWPRGEEQTGPLMECSALLGVSAQVMLDALAKEPKPEFEDLWNKARAVCIP
jgi:hypothetical protein